MADDVTVCTSVFSAYFCWRDVEIEELQRNYSWLVVTCKWVASPSWTMQIEHIVSTSSFGVFLAERVLAMSISDVEDEEEAGQDDSEHRQHGHQYQQPDRDHSRSDLHGYRVRGRIVIYIRTHNNDLCSDIVFLVFLSYWFAYCIQSRLPVHQLSVTARFLWLQRGRGTVCHHRPGPPPRYWLGLV